MLLHADADAFFASVALRSRPELVGRPVAVTAHVVVACASYSARAHGVRAGMHIDEARRRCPDLVLLDVPYAEIEEAGDALFDLFRDLSPAVEPGSIEEAFLAVADESLTGALEVAQTLRRRAAAELGIPVTVGIGRTKLMAKLASRAGKPDGLHVIDEAEEARLRSELPLSDVWGVGRTTLQRLAGLGVQTMADVDAVPPQELRLACGTGMARKLRQIRDGTDDAVIRPVHRRTSFSASGSVSGYARPDHAPEALLRLCLARACHRAERIDLAGDELTITLQVADGRPVQLRRHLPEASAAVDDWLTPALAMLASRPLPRALTGMAVTLAHLVPVNQVQAALF